MTAPAQAQTGIVVRTKPFPLAFLLYLFKTIVTIDGASSELKWGEHFFPVAPGQHEVGVAFKYLYGPMGANGATVQVTEGRVTQVAYKSPFIVFMKGKISVA